MWQQVSDLFISLQNVFWHQFGCTITGMNEMHGPSVMALLSTYLRRPALTKQDTELLREYNTEVSSWYIYNSMAGAYPLSYL